MAVHNTKSDAANTSVRAFLTSVGEQYWGKSFNTASGDSKKIWEHIRDKVFGGKCCYCRKIGKKLTIEHLIMFNRVEFGLHHPGNIAPSCSECNKRKLDGKGKYYSWEGHLKYICKKNGQTDKFEERRNLILKHMTSAKYRYPSLSDEEKETIRVIAESIYDSVKMELDKGLEQYAKLRKAFVKAKVK